MKRISTLLTVFLLLIINASAQVANNVPANNPDFTVMPLTLTTWEGNKDGNKVTLKWALAENELAAQFEVQRSIDGVNYSTVALIFTSEIFGNEDYTFSEKSNAEGKTMYRLKMIEKNSNVAYSKTLLFDSKNDKQNNLLQIIGNPVTNKLTLSYQASHTIKSKLGIYNTVGHCIFTKTLMVTKGNNVWDIPVDFLQSNINYMVEVSDGNEKSATQFLKK